MVGITLSPEQIRSAPREVRQWLERQLAASLGLRPEPDPARDETPRLIALNRAEAADIFGLIKDTVPVVSVFFELGRTGESFPEDGLEAHSLAEMMRHTRLATAEQLVACLQLINAAAQRVCQETDAELCLIDRRGYCLITTETQHSIFGLWQHIIAQPDSQTDRDQIAKEVPISSPLHLSGQISPSAIHMSSPASSSSPQIGEPDVADRYRQVPL